MPPGSTWNKLPSASKTTKRPIGTTALANLKTLLTRVLQRAGVSHPVKPVGDPIRPKWAGLDG
jgi:hypothetical protein